MTFKVPQPSDVATHVIGLAYPDDFARCEATFIAIDKHGQPLRAFRGKHDCNYNDIEVLEDVQLTASMSEWAKMRLAAGGFATTPAE